MVSRKKIEKHLPALFIDGPTTGNDAEYQKIRRKLGSNPVEKKRLIDRIEFALIDCDIFYDEKRGFDLRPIKSRRNA